MSHWDAIDERCFNVVSRTIRILARHQIKYVLGGGWAVYAHVPSVPSVDTDVFLHADLPVDTKEELRDAGLRYGPGQEVEPLAISDRVGFWVFGDEDLGIPEPGFRFSAVLEGNIVEKTLRVAHQELKVPVPDLGALALFKVCALHNRDLAYRSFHDGVAGMQIGPQRMAQVRQLSQSYYLRKAGKDLFDRALLLDAGAAPGLAALAKAHELETILPQILPIIDMAVVKEAQDIGARVNKEIDLNLVAQYLGAATS